MMDQLTTPLLAFVLGFILMVLAWPHIARGHDAPMGAWTYPRECCSGTDCAPLASERVRVTPTGYVVDGRHEVPHGKALVSPDNFYHGCFPQPLQGKIGCLFAPIRGF